jgi:hypothetical protein
VGKSEHVLKYAGMMELGRHGCLKSICPKGRAGSNPALGTHHQLVGDSRVGPGRRHRVVGRSRDDSYMYPRSTIEAALVLSEADVLDRETALICGVSIGAIRHWRRGTRRSAIASGGPMSGCPRCDGWTLDEPDSRRAGLSTNLPTPTCWVSIWATGTSLAVGKMSTL